MKKIKLSRKSIKSSIDDTNLRKIINDICSEVKKTVDERKYVETFLQDIDFNAVEKGIIDKDFEYASDRLDDVFSYYEQCLEDNEYAERYGDIFTDEVVRLLNKLRKQLSIVMVNSSRKSIKSEMTSRQYQNAIDKAARMITEGERDVQKICKMTKLDESDVQAIIDEQDEFENEINSSHKITQSKERSIMNGAIKELEELFSTKAKGNTVYFNDMNYTPLPLPVQNAVKAIMEEYPDTRYRIGLYSVTVLDKGKGGLIRQSRNPRRRLVKSAACYSENTPRDVPFDNGKVVKKGTPYEVVYDRKEGDEYVLTIKVDGVGQTGLRFDSEEEAKKEGWIVSSRRTYRNKISSSGAFRDRDEDENPECIIEIKKDGKWQGVGIDKNSDTGWSTDVKFTVFDSEDKARKSGMAKRVKNAGYSEEDGTLKFSTK